jgi:hypothetical protein
LEHGEQENVIDQFLFYIQVLLKPVLRILIDFGGCQLLLYYLLGTYIGIRVMSIICCYTDTRRLHHILRIRIICRPTNTPELQTVRVVGGRKHFIEKFSALECFRVDAHAQDLLPGCNEHLYFVADLLQTETWIAQGDSLYH